MRNFQTSEDITMPSSNAIENLSNQLTVYKLFNLKRNLIKEILSRHYYRVLQRSCLHIARTANCCIQSIFEHWHHIITATCSKPSLNGLCQKKFAPNNFQDFGQMCLFASSKLNSSLAMDHINTAFDLNFPLIKALEELGVLGVQIIRCVRCK